MDLSCPFEDEGVTGTYRVTPQEPPCALHGRARPLDPLCNDLPRCGYDEGGRHLK